MSGRASDLRKGGGFMELAISIIELVTATLGLITVIHTLLPAMGDAVRRHKERRRNQ